MTETAKLKLNDNTYELPIMTSVEGEKAIDIRKLREETKYVTFDPGFANTGSCISSITYLDGEKGVLRYRGIPIEQIAKKSTFVETAYLLINGQLPTKEQLFRYSLAFTKHANIHESMLKFFEGYPITGHPMAILSAMVCSLSGYYPELIMPEPSALEIENISIELLSKIRTICAYTYKKSAGEQFIFPREDLRYIPNFLNMMFTTPTKEYEILDEVVEALDTLLILHADHEQNCSTSSVRLVGSSWANLFASVSAGICALWGPLHGGANQNVVEMLEKIHEDGGNIQKYIDKAKNADSNYRLMGFGHRVYKKYDPRAKIIKKRADDLLNKLGIHDPLLDIAVKLEEAVLKDEYFVKRRLYPNVDFYSGLIYKTIGIPTNMFPVLFAIGRLPGWIAHWKEMQEDKTSRIGRPRQIYYGKQERDYTPIEERKLI
ncbi:MAG: citrate synthase [Candidatus Omnitrophica bacterium]|nr:citrate synthase [Candidatus Omnitrophota bacterium]